jgi:hypothetical protein
MDIDSGPACLTLREPADENRNGQLDKDEVLNLKKRLTSMATKNFKLAISGAPVAIELKESKISLRDDLRVTDTGISVAVMFEVRHPYAASEGMTLDVTDASPDRTPIVLEVAQESTTPGLDIQPIEIESGKPQRLRLGKLNGE